MSILSARRSDLETSIAAGVFFALFLALASLMVFKVDDLHGDSAVFFQLTENIANHGSTHSQVFGSVTAFVFGSGLMETSPANYASQPLRPAPVLTDQPLAGHAYYILFLLAPLTKIVPVAGLMLTLFAATFVGLLAAAYFFLRAWGVPVVGAALFCALIVSHPPWGESVLYGQFYPDRFFVGAGFLLAYLVVRPAIPRTWLIAAAALCAAINERGALMAGLFLTVYSLLYWKDRKDDRLFRLMLGICLIAYSAVMLKIVLVNVYYGTFLPLNLPGLEMNFQFPFFVQKAILLLLVSSPFLALACFSPRLAVIAWMCLVPNLLGTIGGAEKIGWSTHYPSYYLPFLLFAAAAGYVELFRISAARTRRWMPYAVAGVFVVFLSLLEPGSFVRPTLSLASFSQTFIAQFPHQVSEYYGLKGRELDAEARGVDAAVPRDTLVTAIESAMPFLYKDRHVEMFPVSLDSADYAAVWTGMENGSREFRGAVSILGPVQQAAIDEVVLRRMQRDHYDFEHARIFPNLGIAVIRRLGAKSTNTTLSEKTR